MNNIISSEDEFQKFIADNNKNDIDSFISNLFYKNTKLNCNYFRDKWIQKHKFLFEYLQKRYPDSTSIYETLYRIKYKLDIRPTCKICGGVVTFRKSEGFMKHCSPKCSAIDQETRNKHISTCIEKYGTTSYAQTQEYKEKHKKTCIEKYGVEYPSKLDEVKERSIKTCLERYGKRYVFQNDEVKSKIKKTCLEKYGVENITKSEVMKEKSKVTCLEKYGVQYYLQTEDCLNKRKECRKKNTGVFGSKQENEIFNFLNSLFPDTKREYKSEKYPFHCDFYIPSKDLYIEYNGMWTHNDHPFDEKSDQDIEILRKWEEKSKTSTYYKRAIVVWTIEDVNKRLYAKENNLNWFEAWSFNELKNKILSYISYVDIK